MSGWLLDTDVLSALAPGRPPVPTEIAEWFRERTDRLFLSAVTATEIEAGIAKLRRNASTRRAGNLRHWFDQIIEAYADRVLPFDLSTARVAGRLADAARANGRYPGFADIAIAATAISRELTILTLNLRHFEPLGVEVLNPFADHLSP